MKHQKKILLMAALLLAHSSWGALDTPWTDKVDRAAPLPEYPRPQLQRDTWTNLNGAWDFAVRPAAETTPPAQWQGKILVPFAIESKLSGVERRVGSGERLWYRRTLDVAPLQGGRKWMLHFGAVDWQADIYLNGQHLRRHEGGYDPFSIDINGALRPGREQELVVAVWDPTDTGAQPRGKQVNEPKGIWYTPVTGIWQTVWLEALPAVHVRTLTITPDFDAGRVSVRPWMQGPSVAFTGADVIVRAGGQIVAQARIAEYNTAVDLTLPQPRAWSPDDPFLYDLEVTLRAGNSTDTVRSYFGLRKVERRRAADGFDRIFLNNRPLFMIGPLDQGWWPDGLYTAPTDAALRWDVELTRKLGFNLARKHVKVEPARWYYHCDQLGLMVWQDLPSACRTGTPAHWVRRGEFNDGIFTPEEDAQFRRELVAMVESFRHFPSIICWVPFNEGWGQHTTNDILAWTKRLDPSRLVNGPSGWSDLGYGDLIDLHEYPGPNMFPAQGGRVSVLGEFGGLGLPLEGHLWQSEKNWGYRNMKTVAELTERYAGLIAQLPPLIEKGLAAAIYTQTTDVEGEVNGLITYDRRVVKMPVEKLAALHRALTHPPAKK
jgi:beta-galactosidase/beta-glucuronidase